LRKCIRSRLPLWCSGRLYDTRQGWSRYLAGGKGSDAMGIGAFSLGANHFVVIGNGRGVDEIEDLAVSGLRRRSRSAAGDVELPSRCRACSQ
jgi:hypothetical protein